MLQKHADSSRHFLPLNENYGCYANGNSQNVAKYMDSALAQKLSKLP